MPRMSTRQASPHNSAPARPRSIVQRVSGPDLEVTPVALPLRILTAGERWVWQPWLLKHDRPPGWSTAGLWLQSRAIRFDDRHSTARDPCARRLPLDQAATFPGLKIPSGSSARLIARIISTPAAPCSAARKRDLP